MNKECFDAMFACPEYAVARVNAVLDPKRYTLGEVALLRMLGHDAGQWLDLEREECRAYLAEIRNPRASEPWSERRYSSTACTMPEWLLAQAWGVI